LAGVIDMNYRTFMIYNVIGAFAWAVLLPLIGYGLGKLIPFDDLKTISLFPLAAIFLTLIVVPIILKRLKKNMS
jgi:membrane-associated protein